MAETLASRNEIVGITASGLVSQVDGVERAAPWPAILSVSAAMALVDRTSERRVPVVVCGIMDAADERLFIIGEPEPMWERLTAALADILSAILPIDLWSAELAASRRALLYSRAAGVQ